MFQLSKPQTGRFENQEDDLEAPAVAEVDEEFKQNV